MVMVLVALLQTSEDAYAGGSVRFVHHHSLESSLQSLILFEVLLVLVQCGGTYAAQFTSCQSRLQYVGSIHGTFALSGTHQCVYLIDEEDDAAFALGHLVDHALEPLLEFALVLGSSHQSTHIEAVELFVLQVLGHIATQYPVSQTLYDGCLTSTWFAYQYRVVLGTTRQNLQHTPYLLVTSYHGIQFACPCFIHQVTCIFAQTLVGVFARLAGHLLSASQFAHCLLEIVLGESHILENLAGSAIHFGNGHEQMLHRYILVTSLLCQVFGFLQHLT